MLTKTSQRIQCNMVWKTSDFFQFQCSSYHSCLLVYHRGMGEISLTNLSGEVSHRLTIGPFQLGNPKTIEFRCVWTFLVWSNTCCCFFLVVVGQTNPHTTTTTKLYLSKLQEVNIGSSVCCRFIFHFTFSLPWFCIQIKHKICKNMNCVQQQHEHHH